MRRFALIATALAALAACSHTPKPLNPHAFGRPSDAEKKGSFNAVEWAEAADIGSVHKALLAGMERADISVTKDATKDGYITGQSNQTPDAVFNAFYIRQDGDIRVLMSVTGQNTDIIQHVRPKEITQGILRDVREGFGEYMTQKNIKGDAK
jgi:hypothetical protein